MNPTAPLSEESQHVLQQLEEMLDEMIGCQREEQECILNREVARLPVICERINALSVRMERHQLNLKTFIQARPMAGAQEALRVACIRKFRQIQEMARQNHMLLEHSLRFLQQVLSEFLGAKRNHGGYNHMGALAGAFARNGLLMDLKI